MVFDEYQVVVDDRWHPVLEKTKDIYFEGLCDEYDDTPQLDYMIQAAQIFIRSYKLHRMAEEYFYVISLSNDWKVKGIYQLGHGTSTEVRTSMRGLFIFLLLSGADSFIVVHNHVCGGLEPSPEDLEATERIQQSAALLELEFLAHYIVSEDGWYEIISEERNEFKK